MNLVRVVVVSCHNVMKLNLLAVAQNPTIELISFPVLSVKTSVKPSQRVDVRDTSASAFR
jgi:hypothetical protein